MIRACIFDIGGTIVDKYSLTPLLSLKSAFALKKNKCISRTSTKRYGNDKNGSH